MANMVSLSSQYFCNPKSTPLSVQSNSNHSSIDNGVTDSYSAFDDEIPTVDYSLLLSDDPLQQSLVLERLGQACCNFGFFYLVNHGIPDRVPDNLFKGISEFFDPMNSDERKLYRKKDPRERIRGDISSSNSHGDNREYLKVMTHPQCHFPSHPFGFSEVLGEYHKEMRNIVEGLARAMSKALGFEENYIEKAFNLESGFDVSALNLYPPNHASKGHVGIGDHTDPGFIITLMQDVDGGLQILSHNGKWLNAYIPYHAILIQLGDHLEILTNGKYKSHVHRVIVGNNKVQRFTVATLHGPSLDKFVAPAPEFVDEDHPRAYVGMTYKQSLEAKGHDEIDVQSSLDKIRLLDA
ncbi:2-oxoglutarate-dependent dioxygenase 19-like [Prosopis cineraria]|uniref:2-oxoglutarate-dependent dioxygenase 19-like n=1 Tax=Prosopis cineraria TaxID=364024 RepID=UPI00240F05BC|nr:2-oxoglutarate-dependent dioxygenase 19-like [Prosopis cineraria]